MNVKIIKKFEKWFWMKFSLVQILVVVANIQVRLLKTEVENGFMRTAIDHELVDPKAKINFVNKINGETRKNLFWMPKGNKFNITWLRIGYFCGNATEIRNISE